MQQPNQQQAKRAMLSTDSVAGMQGKQEMDALLPSQQAWDSSASRPDNNAAGDRRRPIILSSFHGNMDGWMDGADQAKTSPATKLACPARTLTSL